MGRAKSARNTELRGLPFELAVLLFDEPTLETADARQDYSEARVRAIGEVENTILVCVFTDRNPDTRRIISLRVANQRERNEYRATYQSGD